MVRMYLDDIRSPQGEFDIIMRSSKTAINYMERYGCPGFISFDHDLGGEDTAIILIKWMVEMDMDLNYEFIPEGFEFNVHSANPVGAANINGYLKSYFTQRKKAQKEDNL